MRVEVRWSGTSRLVTMVALLSSATLSIPCKSLGSKCEQSHIFEEKWFEEETDTQYVSGLGFSWKQSCGFFPPDWPHVIRILGRTFHDIFSSGWFIMAVAGKGMDCSEQSPSGLSFKLPAICLRRKQLDNLKACHLSSHGAFLSAPGVLSLRTGTYLESSHHNSLLVQQDLECSL